MNHMRTHTAEKLSKCTMCEKVFRDEKALVRHEKIHSGKKPFQCSICDKVFLNKWELVRHKKVHAGSNYIDLSLHKITHTGEKTLKCTIYHT